MIYSVVWGFDADNDCDMIKAKSFQEAFSKCFSSYTNGSIQSIKRGAYTPLFNSVQY